jgi:hypothetical protein
VNQYNLACFLKRIEKNEETGCWDWVGRISISGKGSRRGIMGTSDHRNMYAHRVAYEHYVGPIAEGNHIHHTCGNKLCVNPDHLRSVTIQEHRMAHQ